MNPHLERFMSEYEGYQVSFFLFNSKMQINILGFRKLTLAQMN